MPYVYRDAEGAIAAVYEQPVEGGEEVAVDDSALIAFIQKNVPVAVTDEWVQSDLALARVMEDLIEILIDKKVMMFTDFPEGAQKKLLERRGFRKEFSSGTTNSGATTVIILAQAGCFKPSLLPAPGCLFARPFVLGQAPCADINQPPCGCRSFQT